MPWLVEQLPSPVTGPPLPDERYFQCWSEWRRNYAVFYDRKHALEMSEAEAREIVLYIGKDLVKAVEVEND